MDFSKPFLTLKRSFKRPFFFFLLCISEKRKRNCTKKNFHLDALSVRFLQDSKSFSNKGDGHFASVAQTVSRPNKSPKQGQSVLPAWFHKNFSPQPLKRKMGLWTPLEGNLPEIAVRTTSTHMIEC